MTAQGHGLAPGQPALPLWLRRTPARRGAPWEGAGVPGQEVIAPGRVLQWRLPVSPCKLLC